MVDNLCRVPIIAVFSKDPETGESFLDEEKSTWADIPADVIARKLIEGFGLDLKGGDADE